MWALRMLDFGKYKGYFKNHATLIPAYPTSRASGVSGTQILLNIKDTSKTMHPRLAL